MDESLAPLLYPDLFQLAQLSQVVVGGLVTAEPILTLSTALVSLMEAVRPVDDVGRAVVACIVTKHCCPN